MTPVAVAATQQQRHMSGVQDEDSEAQEPPGQQLSLANLLGLEDRVGSLRASGELFGDEGDELYGMTPSLGVIRKAKASSQAKAGRHSSRLAPDRRPKHPIMPISHGTEPKSSPVSSPVANRQVSLSGAVDDRCKQVAGPQS
jgi:hypothetical protein